MLFLSIVLTSCDRPPELKPITVIPDSTQGGIFIVNEGLFMQGNGELSFINLGLNQLFNNVFFQANNKNLGDVFQSINIINGNAYLVVNNSSKIEIINPFTFKSLGTISGLNSPRYIVKTSTNKAYVSDLYDNHISVIDLSTNLITGKIPFKGWSEEMLSLNGKMYVTNIRSKFIGIIDENTHLLIDSIETPFASKNIVKDSANNIWVLCGDANASDKRHFLIKINVNQKSVEKKLEFKVPNSSANRLKINNEGNSLFWIDESVFKMNIYDTILPATALINNDKKLFYGLGIDPFKNEIYVSDVKDFNSISDVYRYNFNGQLLGKFSAGKITSDFYFFNP